MSAHGSENELATWSRGGQRRRRRAALTACVLLPLALVGGFAQGSEPVRVPVVFHVLERDGQAVAPASFIAQQLSAANAIYVPLGIEFVELRRSPLPGVAAELVTRTDRDALARHVQSGAVHCFVVARLMDVDEPGRERRGVHWHPRAGAQQSFLIVSKISAPYVLAHELGHLLGNREHSNVAGNLMSYTRADGPPFLDQEQVRRVRQTLAELLRTRALVPLAKPTQGTP